jgi:hypothetical protein
MGWAELGAGVGAGRKAEREREKERERAREQFWDEKANGESYGVQDGLTLAYQFVREVKTSIGYLASFSENHIWGNHWLGLEVDGEFQRADRDTRLPTKEGGLFSNNNI